MTLNEFVFPGIVHLDPLRCPFRHHGERDDGIIGQDPAVAGGSIEPEKIVQPHVIAAADGFFRDVVPAGFHPRPDAIDGPVGGVQPEIEDRDRIAVGPRRLDGFQQGTGRQGGFDAEILVPLEKVARFQEHVTAGRNLGLFRVEGRQTLGKLVRVYELGTRQQLGQ